MSASVSYRLGLPRPGSHLVDVEMRVARAGTLGEHIDVRMAAWSPGSYLIRDYARFVRGLRARHGDAPLSTSKLDKHTWRICDVPADCDELVIEYQVYGHDLTVRTNHIDDTHAFLHGPATYLTIEALRDQPSSVEVVPPDERWIIATGLDPDEPAWARRFRASSADHLLDCPIHVSHPEHTRTHTMEVLGTPVRLVVWGRIDSFGVADMNRLADDLAAIVRAHAARFDDRLPCAHYTFMLMLTPGGYGGLEHGNSSANLHNPFCMESKDEYYGLLELLSHEFFHVWNGKRMFPPALARFDYQNECYTRCLWVMEGLTSYYDRYTALRASDMTVKRYLGKLAEEWSQYQKIAGRRVHSLEDASFDAWIKLYKPDESNINTTVSYYLAGGLAALVLDLEVRARTEGARSLDDVLALLWREYGEKGLPYPEDVRPIFERATGLDLGDYFERVIRGREDPDLGTALGLVGLALAGEPGENKDDARDDAKDDRPRVWLGAFLDAAHGRVTQVLDGSPAERAGLSPGDVIIALDGWQVRGRGEIDKRLRGRVPGQEVELAVFRRKRLTQVRVALEQAPPRRLQIVAIEADAAQKARYAEWLGEAHPGPGKVASGGAAHWS